MKHVVFGPGPPDLSTLGVFPHWTRRTLARVFPFGQRLLVSSSVSAASSSTHGCHGNVQGSAVLLSVAFGMPESKGAQPCMHVDWFPCCFSPPCSPVDLSSAAPCTHGAPCTLKPENGCSSSGP